MDGTATDETQGQFADIQLYPTEHSRVKGNPGHKAFSTHADVHLKILSANFSLGMSILRGSQIGVNFLNPRVGLLGMLVVNRSSCFLQIPVSIKLKRTNHTR